MEPAFAMKAMADKKWKMEDVGNCEKYRQTSIIHLIFLCDLIGLVHKRE